MSYRRGLERGVLDVDFVVLALLLGRIGGLESVGIGRLRLFGGEHEELFPHDLGAVLLDAVGVFPRAGLEVTLDVDFLAFGYVLLDDFRQTAPEDYGMEFGRFLLVAGGVLPLAGSGDSDGGDLLAVGGFSDFGSSDEVADELDLVEGIHARGEG